MPRAAATGFFETYFLISNPWDAARTVTLTYRHPNGTIIGTDAIVPAGGRGAVWANDTAGAQDFSTEVTSTWVVVERAMYWPTGSSLLSSGDAQAMEPAASDAAPTARKPPLLEDGSGSPPRPTRCPRVYQDSLNA